MNKPIFRLLDEKGRLLIPQSIRESTGIEKGDVVTISAGQGVVVVKKAIVLEGDRMTPGAKRAYLEAMLREMPADGLAEFLELAAHLNQEKNRSR